MKKAPGSAGVLLFRHTGDALDVLLARPGGPYWRSKDVGAWQIPKGAIEVGEAPVEAALREAEEELGFRPQGELLPLGQLRQAGGKLVEAFAVEAMFDPAQLVSNSFEMEWPPRSGRRERFPELEEVRWFGLDAARAMILPSQLPFLDRLADLFPHVAGDDRPASL
ncbi:NUDIX domain-containing protein [Sphingomonas sp.]|jgi:predicted NUDIX family NTP pyrophosphohydrolase|uniref:NUDIX domain-containing protein n=1 Tax=Sphingomonas sp. TaxID=28214 RepID=UPI002DE6943B|nr:NUDIX domain-containing protein [Sphingomonas sp.]HEV2567303.1 NUDIX domain-containing protein [Sphingomonas sp.]